MSTPRRPAKQSGRLDRFATHAWIIDNVPEIVGGSGYAAVVLLLYLWDKAFASDGRTRCDVRISSLARAIGAERKTVRAALVYLTEHGWITPAGEGEGYTVWHHRKGEFEQEDTGE